MESFKQALAFLTIIPVRFKDDGSSEPAFSRDQVAWYPLVGLVIALPSFFIAMFMQWAFDSTTIAVLIIATQALLTRMLHWDALADVADAWWGGATPERRREIMSDSHTGSYALVTVSLTILALFLALIHIVDAKMFAMLLVAPTIARCAPLFGLWLGVPAKPEGLGAAMCGAPTQRSLVIAGVTLLGAVGLACVSLGPLGIVVSFAGILVCGAFPHFAAQRFGGVTGDVVGYGVILGELAIYALALVVI